MKLNTPYSQVQYTKLTEQQVESLDGMKFPYDMTNEQKENIKLFLCEIDRHSPIFMNAVFNEGLNPQDENHPLVKACNHAIDSYNDYRQSLMFQGYDIPRQKYIAR